MNETYYEILIEKKKSSVMNLARILTAVMAVLFVFVMIIGMWWGLIFAVAFGAASYLLNFFNSVEYEYLYIDKELQIDRILAKNNRKRMETLDLMEMEVLAPIRSHELDRYCNKQRQTVDYSSGDESHNNLKYMLVLNGRQIIFEPTLEMVKTIQMFAPRKVFTY